MGKYINPPDTTKEAWLAANGKAVTVAQARAASSSGGKPVCLVHNGAFTAAGIAYDAREFEAFCGPHDTRPKQWYLVPTNLLEPYL